MLKEIPLLLSVYQSWLLCSQRDLLQRWKFNASWRELGDSESTRGLGTISGPWVAMNPTATAVAPLPRRAELWPASTAFSDALQSLRVFGILWWSPGVCEAFCEILSRQKSYPLGFRYPVKTTPGTCTCVWSGWGLTTSSGGGWKDGGTWKV